MTCTACDIVLEARSSMSIDAHLSGKIVGTRMYCCDCGDRALVRLRREFRRVGYDTAVSDGRLLDAGGAMRSISAKVDWWPCHFDIGVTKRGKIKRVPVIGRRVFFSGDGFPDIAAQHPWAVHRGMGGEWTVSHTIYGLAAGQGATVRGAIHSAAGRFIRAGDERIAIAIEECRKLSAKGAKA